MAVFPSRSHPEGCRRRRPEAAPAATTPRPEGCDWCSKARSGRGDAPGPAAIRGAATVAAGARRATAEPESPRDAAARPAGASSAAAALALLSSPLSIEPARPDPGSPPLLPAPRFLPGCSPGRRLGTPSTGILPQRWRPRAAWRLCSRLGRSPTSRRSRGRKQRARGRAATATQAVQRGRAGPGGSGDAGGTCSRAQAGSGCRRRARC